MDYIYDIILNFQKEFYDFYEWKVTDKIVNIKRIPIYKIKTPDYLSIKKNYVTINRESLPKGNKMFLITSGFEVMGILLDDNGNALKKSSLLFEEADEILEDKELIKEIDIKYNVKKYNKQKDIMSRVSKEKSEYINKYLSNIDKVRDEYILKYIYYDIFNEEELNIDKLYDKLITLSNNDQDKIYDCLKRISNL